MLICSTAKGEKMYQMLKNTLAALTKEQRIAVLVKIYESGSRCRFPLIT